jgi:hypothetical protein
MDATPTQDLISANMSPAEPQDTTLESDVERRHDADSEQQTKPRKASGIDTARIWQTDVKRCLACDDDSELQIRPRKVPGCHKGRCWQSDARSRDANRRYGAKRRHI